jgi:hypothetical protein
VKHKPRTLAVDEKVWLSAAHLRTSRPSKKLDQKRIGPFRIVERIGLQAYRLELPTTMKIHDVFHVSLLEPAKQNVIPDRTQPPPLPVELESVTEYEVEDILDSRVRHRKLQYLVKWVGYPPFENSWEPATFVENSKRLVKAFHEKYPLKPSRNPTSTPTSAVNKAPSKRRTRTK